MMFSTGKHCIFFVVELPSVKAITLLPEYCEMCFSLNGLWTWTYESFKNGILKYIAVKCQW